MSPHKLLITTKLRTPSRYKKLLSGDEMVAGRRHTHIITIKNIGDKSFPSSSVRIDFEQPIGMEGIFQSATFKKEALLKAKETRILEARHTPPIPGVWTMKIELKPKDRKKIVYYKSEDKQEQVEWSRLFYIFDRNQLDIRILLEELLKKGV